MTVSNLTTDSDFLCNANTQKREISPRGIILLLQLMFCSMGYFSLKYLEPEAALMIIGIWNLIIWSIMLFYEVKDNNTTVLSPIFFYIAKSILTSGACNIFISRQMHHGIINRLSGIYIDESYYCLAALLVMLEEMLVMSFFYSFFARLRHEENSETTLLRIDEKKYFNLLKELIIFMSFVLLVHYFFLSTIRLGSFFDFIVSYGFICIALSAAVYYICSSEKSKKLLMFIIAISFVQGGISMAGNSKESIILSFISLIYIGINSLKKRAKRILNIKMIVLGLLFLYFVAFVVFPSVSHRRMVRSTENYEIGYDELVDYIIEVNTLGSRENYDIWDIEGNGFAYFLSRNNLTVPVSFAIQEVATKGTIGYRFTKEGLMALVPRIIWPGKPHIAMGAEMDSFIRNGVFYSSSGSSTCLGMCGNSYIQGGMFPVIISCFLNGGTLALCLYLISKRWYNPILMIPYFMLCKQAFRHFESVFDLGLSNLIPLSILLLLIPLDSIIQKRVFKDRNDALQ